MAAEQSADKRDARGRFLPGQAPKSPGRPAVARDFKAWCRSVLEQGSRSAPAGQEQIVAMLHSDGEDRRFALRLLVEYGYGKPTQHIQVSLFEQAQAVAAALATEGITVTPDQLVSDYERLRALAVPGASN